MLNEMRMLNESGMTATVSSLVIKRINRHLCDVFFGDGWDNWARFEIRRIKGKAFPIKQQGVALPKELFAQLCEELSAN